jgi:hypothetical protein
LSGEFKIPNLALLRKENVDPNLCKNEVSGKNLVNAEIVYSKQRNKMI